MSDITQGLQLHDLLQVITVDCIARPPCRALHLQRSVQGPKGTAAAAKHMLWEPTCWLTAQTRAHRTVHTGGLPWTRCRTRQPQSSSAAWSARTCAAWPGSPQQLSHCHLLACTEKIHAQIYKQLLHITQLHFFGIGNQRQEQNTDRESQLTPRRQLSHKSGCCKACSHSTLEAPMVQPWVAEA